MFSILFGVVIVLSILLIVLAFARKSRVLAIVGAALSVPASFYLGAQPVFFYIPWAFPFAVAISGILIGRGQVLSAALLCVPYVVLASAVILFGIILDVW